MIFDAKENFLSAFRLHSIILQYDATAQIINLIKNTLNLLKNIKRKLVAIF
jgi:hypothetical protein